MRQTIDDAETIIIGDLILLEVLLGVSDESAARRLERFLRTFDIEPMLNDRLAVIAARNYRTLRSVGITIRRPIDVVIGTYCIDHGYALLHNDRDFEPMHDRLGLRRALTPP